MYDGTWTGNLKGHQINTGKKRSIGHSRQPWLDRDKKPYMH